MREVIDKSNELYLPLQEISRRIQWLINLRWVAVVSLGLTLCAVRFLFRLPLPLLPLFVGNMVQLVLNAIYLAGLRSSWLSHGRWGLFTRISVFINVQISLDLLLLNYLLYFSGGIENPFFLFFVFHMVIASILLSNRAAYLQAGFAMFMFGAVLTAEYVGLIPHHNLGVLSGFEILEKPLHMLGVFVSLVSTLFITVYMTTTIVNRMRAQDKSLSRTNRRLQEKDREKSLYLRTVSHDIKGGLSAIQNCLRVVLNGLAGETSEKSAEMVGRAEHRSLRLLRFVNELLYLSMIRAGERMSDREVRLSEIAGRVIRDYEAPAEDKGVTLSLRDNLGDTTILADLNALDQLLMHLIDNAVKFTAPGGRITVMLDRDDAGVRVSVTDTGTGIDQIHQPHVFEDFYCVESSREPQRIGLGLAIAKQIVDLYGGEIGVESTPGKGSIFTFSLPVTGS